MKANQEVNKVHISAEITDKIKKVYFRYIIFLALFSFMFLYISFGISFELAILTFSMLFLLGVFRMAYNDLVDLSLMGEYVIIKKSEGKNFVTPINRIKKCKSTKILRFVFTSFEFHLDGSKRKVFFLSSSEKKQVFDLHRGQKVNVA